MAPIFTAGRFLTDVLVSLTKTKPSVAAGILLTVASAAIANAGPVTKDAGHADQSFFLKNITIYNTNFEFLQRLCQNFDSADASDEMHAADGGKVPMAVLQIANSTLHIPNNYIDASDGFQNNFGYIKIRALLPCLIAETRANTGEFHTRSLGHIVVASLSKWDVHSLTGFSLLDARISLDRSVDYLRTNSEKSEGNEELPGTGFHLYKSGLLGLDIFSQNGSNPLFVLECGRRDNFAKSPSCSSRSVMEGSLLLEYRFNRSYIDNALQGAIVIDKNVQKLFRIFLSSNPEMRSLEKGVCQ